MLKRIAVDPTFFLMRFELNIKTKKEPRTHRLRAYKPHIHEPRTHGLRTQGQRAHERRACGYKSKTIVHRWQCKLFNYKQLY